MKHQGQNLAGVRQGKRLYVSLSLNSIQNKHNTIKKRVLERNLKVYFVFTKTNYSQDNRVDTSK